jgi:hypothetical protein
MSDEATNRELQTSLMRSEEEIHRLRQLINEVKEAINFDGPVPEYHRHLTRKHRSEWPRLWSALDELTK